MARLAQGLLQSELALRAEVSRGTVVTLESSGQTTLASPGVQGQRAPSAGVAQTHAHTHAMISKKVLVHCAGWGERWLLGTLAHHGHELLFE